MPSGSVKSRWRCHEQRHRLSWPPTTRSMLRHSGGLPSVRVGCDGLSVDMLAVLASSSLSDAGRDASLAHQHLIRRLRESRKNSKRIVAKRACQARLSYSH